MPSIDKQKNSQNKKRLGRGLGSLLSTDASDFEDQPTRKGPTSGSGAASTTSSSVASTNKDFKTSKAALSTQKPSAENLKNEKRSNETAETSKTISTESQKASPVPEKAKENVSLSEHLRVWSLAVEKVVPNKTQPRKDFLKEPLEELAQSIKEQGVLQPITVRKKGDEYEIIAGERRWRASQLAGLKEVPAIVKDVDDQKSMELALIENLQRENLNPVEEAMGYQLLIDDYDLSQQELAGKVGKSRSTITNSLRVLTLPRDVRQMLRQGLLSVGHAKVLLGVDDIKTQTGLARKAIQKKLSVRALEKEVTKSRSTKSSDINELDVSERLAKGLGDDLQKALGTKVQIKYQKGKGKIEISFYSDDELSALCEKIKNTGKLSV